MAKVELYTEPQYYKGIRLDIVVRHDYHVKGAMRFRLGDTNQNVWIPNKHLYPNGIIRENENIDYVFRRSNRQLELAGYVGPIPGIKRAYVTVERN